jgi:hypothetical protein
MSNTTGPSDRPGTIAHIAYGKANVAFYRTYAKPLRGLMPIPESSFVGRPNILFAYDAEAQVLDQTLAPAYTEGDNSLVVATDTMKNFIHQVAIEFEGATLEEYRAWADSARSDARPSDDGESRLDIVARYARALRVLLGRSERVLLVVAHSLPIAYVLATRSGELPRPRVPLVTHAALHRFTGRELEQAADTLEAWVAAPTW